LKPEHDEVAKKKRKKRKKAQHPEARKTKHTKHMKPRLANARYHGVSQRHLHGNTL